MKIVDMHCDTVSELFHKRKKYHLSNTHLNEKEICLRENTLNLDLVRLKDSEYMLQNFAMFIDLEQNDNPFESCMEMIDFYYMELEKNSDIILPAFTYSDIMNNYKSGRMSALLTIEEGGVLKGNLSYLRDFYRLGVRMITLTWNYMNEIGYPNARKTDHINELYGTYDDKNGLRSFGIECIREMERLGMIIDVSHLSDAGFYDVLKNTNKPFTASHSNARSLSSHARNMNDDMIKALSKRNGVIGMCYHPPFLSVPIHNSEEYEYTGFLKVAKHIKHIYNIAGYECIGLGSDFDGMLFNKDIKDVSFLSMLEDALWKTGFGQEQIEAVFYKNVLRLYKEILK